MKFYIYGVIIYSYIVVYIGVLVCYEWVSLVCLDFFLCSKNRFMLI